MKGAVVSQKDLLDKQVMSILGTLPASFVPAGFRF